MNFDEFIQPNDSRGQGILYCEECGWIACALPEILKVGALCATCNHILGTSGRCYDYETKKWDYEELNNNWR